MKLRTLWLVVIISTLALILSSLISSYAQASEAQKAGLPKASNGKREVKVITGFNSTPEQTDEEPCLSANGENICELYKSGSNSCASSLPFGTRLYIQGLGECIVRDRLAVKYAQRIDWYFGGKERINAARSFGKKKILVFIYD